MGPVLFTQLLVVTLNFEFNVALCPQRPYGLIWTQDGHLDFHTAPEL